jgi:hypothetical protein
MYNHTYFMPYVSTVTDYRLDLWGLNPSKAKTLFSFSQCPASSGAHPGSCPVGTGVPSDECKVAGVWSWPLITILCQGWECMELYQHSSIHLKYILSTRYIQLRILILHFCHFLFHNYNVSANILFCFKYPPMDIILPRVFINVYLLFS